MSVITASKGIDEVVQRLRRSDARAVVLGCDKCAKLSRTGGADEVRAMLAVARHQSERGNAGYPAGT